MTASLQSGILGWSNGQSVSVSVAVSSQSQCRPSGRIAHILVFLFRVGQCTTSRHNLLHCFDFDSCMRDLCGRVDGPDLGMRAGVKGQTPAYDYYWQYIVDRNFAFSDELVGSSAVAWS